MRSSIVFQFTRPRGARPCPVPRLDGYTGFNSRAREGRDANLVIERVQGLVVSIHAPARGATMRQGHIADSDLRFNSRAREGRDRQGNAFGRKLQVVSIHAPARGATATVTCPARLRTSFQFTRPRGARHAWKAGSIVEKSFNSRAREGRDGRTAVVIGIRATVSIHAPARGATVAAEKAQTAVEMFQFTRPRGARPAAQPEDADEREVSIHAPARGATVVHLMLVFLCFFREVFAEPAANDVSWRLLSFRFR